MQQKYPAFGALFIILFLAMACTIGKQDADLVVQHFRQGNFKRMREAANRFAEKNPGSQLPAGYEILLAKADRIIIDFNKSESDIINELQPWFPNLDDAMLEQWEKSGKLEMRLIDGEKRYFRNAVANLFRIDSIAMKVKAEKEGIVPDPLDGFCLQHTTGILQKYAAGFNHEDLTQKFMIEYTVTLPAHVVPAGETIRCWLPFPRESMPRQRNVQLLSVNADQYQVAGNQALQRSLYIEKESVAGEDAVFSYTAVFETSPQWFDLQQINVSPYDTSTTLYRTYTAERPPHIVFSDDIVKLAGTITAGLTDPVSRVRAIYKWINRNIPWASANEYSIMENIPQYVLKNMRGDCGMQTLLFMTLARCSGIPCKWQSGWMLHPGEVNLHDWAEVYYEGTGWVPLDQSFGLQDSSDEQVKEFYVSGIDSYRMIVNDDYSSELIPAKTFYRSEPVDFQRGELEWKNGNIYFNEWKYNMKVTLLDP